MSISGPYIVVPCIEIPTAHAVQIQIYSRDESGNDPSCLDRLLCLFGVARAVPVSPTNTRRADTELLPLMPSPRIYSSNPAICHIDISPFLFRR